MLVMKFGGTSVGDGECFRNVAQIIMDTHANDDQVGHCSGGYF